jgi:hypothetical protein
MDESPDPTTLMQTIYVSSATKLFDEAALLELLRKARGRNALVGVTGMLLYRDGNFMQVLEGPASALDEVLARIERDPRHHGLLVLSSKPIEQREFGDWSMGFVHAAEIDEPSFSPFLQRSGEIWTPEESRRGKRLLQTFKTQMR